jgi:methylenetetrahydrofolate reductase (NADPH)
MKRLRDVVAGGKEFVITCEFVPGRGSQGKSVDKAIEFGECVLRSKLPIHAISITNNPGGNPAISPDVLGSELKSMGVETLIHFSCTDSNRNAIESRVSSLARVGLDNLLIVTGDYPAGGFEGTAKSVYDLDSVQALRYVKERNRGLEIPGRGDGAAQRLPATDFFVGSVVSPFKHTEPELMTQLYKLEKKIATGADYIITQLGYDVRKVADIRNYLSFRGIEIPLFGNVYVISKTVAHIMHAGEIPGCVVTEGLLRRIDEESGSDDKGKKARLDRSAKLTAVYQGMGLRGVHIGGFGLTCDDFEYIIRRAGEMSGNWQEIANEFNHSPQGSFMLFPGSGVLQTGGGTPVRQTHNREYSVHFFLSRIVHALLFDPRSPGYHIMRAYYVFAGRIPWVFRASYLFEHVVKSVMFDCRECGDCALFDCAYLCPMSQCAKFMRNGPCGGSINGMCEADHDKVCVWTRIYKRYNSARGIEFLRSAYIPPVNHSLARTSSWANYYLERDHTSKRMRKNG